MASLVEELLDVMALEEKKYEDLYALSQEKRGYVVHRQIPQLEEITTREQNVSSDLKNLENKRVRILSDMSVVLGHEDEMLTVTGVIGLLSKQPKEQEALRGARDRLVRAANRMQVLNEQNEKLLQQALEMVEFDMTLAKSMRGAPETGNYNRSAYNTGDVLPTGAFDAKQ